MNKSEPDHDTLVTRLASILRRLNDGEVLEPAQLAKDFNVNKRTIQRDLNQRLAGLDLDKSDGKYRLHPASLGRLSRRDLMQFAALAGVRGLFPSITESFLRDIFDSRVQAAWLVKGHSYEDLGGKSQLFHQIELAIGDCLRISFDYTKADTCKAYRDVEPYKLLNQKGIWYLAAVDAGKLKTFSFSCLDRLLVSAQSFEPDPALHERLIEEDGVWLSEQRLEIVLKVSAEVAGYFKRRKLIANQVIEKELADGALIVSARVGHANQVLPIVRYWIPHLKIISPESLQAELDRGLAAYLAR